MLERLNKYKTVRTFMIFLLTGKYKHSIPMIHNIDDILTYIQHNKEICDVVERLSNKGELDITCLIEDLRSDVVFKNALAEAGILKF